MESKLRVESSLDSVAGDAVIRTYFPTGPAVHKMVVRALHARFGASASVIWADDLGVELLSRGTNKGRALATVAQTMGISRAETAAIGDGPNDLQLMRVAGTSAAMRNAPANVRAAARYVVPTSAEDGVVHALRRQRRRSGQGGACRRRFRRLSRSPPHSRRLSPAEVMDLVPVPATD